MEKENLLILLMCISKKNQREIDLVNSLLTQDLNWGYILGELIHHRLSGYFISYFPQDKVQNLFKEVNKQLTQIYRTNKYITEKNMVCITELCSLFDKENIRYAGLKGVVYNCSMYDLGVRRSNDIDLLVLEDDLDKLDKVLHDCGFIQTLNSKCEEATRRDKLIQRMNHHDLIPYYRSNDNDIILPYNKIDINFKVDTKNEFITKQFFDFGTEEYTKDNFKIKGLRWETHLLQLCIHFYREATENIWIAQKRDCMLYKIVDIENTIRYFGAGQLNDWLDSIKFFDCYESVYLTFKILNKYYKNNIYESIIEKLGNVLKLDIDDFVKKFVNSSFDLSYKI